MVANEIDIKLGNWEISLDEIFGKSKSINCSFILINIVDMSDFAEFREYIKSKYTILASHSCDGIVLPNKNSESSCLSDCMSIG